MLHVSPSPSCLFSSLIIQKLFKNLGIIKKKSLKTNCQWSSWAVILLKFAHHDVSLLQRFRYNKQWSFQSTVKSHSHGCSGWWYPGWLWWLGMNRHVLRKVNLTTLTLHEVWPGIIAAARSAGALAVSKNKPSVKPEAFITHLKSTISRKYNNSKMRVLHRHSTQLILPNYNPTTYILNAEKHCLLDDLQWQSSGDGDTCFSLQVWRAHSDAQMHSAWAQRVSTACAENTMYCDCS